MVDVMRGVADEGEAGITRLLALANLSHDRLTGYLLELVDKGWLHQEGDRGRRRWTLTTEGHRVLRELQRVADYMQDFGLDL